MTFHYDLGLELFPLVMLVAEKAEPTEKYFFACVERSASFVAWKAAKLSEE